MRVIIPTALRRYTSGNRQLEFEADTVALVLNQITQTYPELQPHLFDESGKIQPFVNIFVNDTNIRDLDHEQTTLRNTDELILVPPIAGG